MLDFAPKRKTLPTFCRPNLLDDEKAAITAKAREYLASAEPLPPRDDPTYQHAREQCIKYHIQLMKADWPENPYLPQKLRQCDWYIAVTNAING